MTDDIRITNVTPSDGLQWLVTGEYLTEEAKADPARGGGGMFQAYTPNRSIVAVCLGAQKLGYIVRVHWRESKTRGFRDLLMASVL